MKFNRLVVQDCVDSTDPIERVGKDHVAMIKLALAKEHHDRASLIGLWTNQGNISILQTDDPGTITVRLDDEFFSEARDKFPTSTLIARLQLAIASGRSDRNNPAVAQELAQVHHIGTPRRSLTRDEIFRDDWIRADALASAYHNVAEITRVEDERIIAEITAKVTAAAAVPRKLMKGRP